MTIKKCDCGTYNPIWGQQRCCGCGVAIGELRPRLDPAMRERVFEALEYAIDRERDEESDARSSDKPKLGELCDDVASALEHALAFLKEHC